MKTTKTVRASRKIAASTVKRPISSSRAIKADDEIEEIEDFEEEAPIEDDFEEVPEEDVDSELLFEADDVASIIAEITEEPVDYTVDDETSEVTFTYGDAEITVTPEGDEEVVEQSTRVIGKKVQASKMAKPARKVSASRRIRK